MDKSLDKIRLEKAEILLQIGEMERSKDKSIPSSSYHKLIRDSLVALKKRLGELDKIILSQDEKSIIL